MTGPAGAPEEEIALVGLGLVLPGAETVADLGALLRDGRSRVGAPPPGRAGVSGPGGWLDRDIDRFDPAFFGMSTKEAELTDPQHRLLLECTWRAFEDAAIPIGDHAGREVGVYVGVSTADHCHGLVRAGVRPSPQTLIGSSHSFAANRISHQFGFLGESVAVDTACSSSLVALAQGVRALRLGAIDLAVVGGVNVILEDSVTEALRAGGAISPTGACHTFDEAADGYVRGEGCVVVVLKRMADAERDRDRVRSAVLGVGVGHAGRSNGIMAPSRAGQVVAIRNALAESGVDPRRIRYVEAHGTGTTLGDAIEARALSEAMGLAEGDDVRLGSIKTNVGHLEAAAGLAGVAAATLAIEGAALHPLVGLDAESTSIPFARLGLRTQGATEPWPDCERRLAGVSSFGVGGTNAHVVLGEPQPVAARPVDDEPGTVVLRLSAKTPERLDALARRIADDGGDDDRRGLADTLAFGRTHARFRRAVAVAPGDDVRAALAGARTHETRPRTVAFVFSGQGGQWDGMGEALLALDGPRRWLRREDAGFAAVLGWSPLERLAADVEQQPHDVVQPLLFLVQVALARHLAAEGLRPRLLLGHSLGEVAAACTAGALTVTDGLRVVHARSTAMARFEGTGAMAMVALAADEVGALAARAGADVTVAAENSTVESVVSGSEEAVARLLAAVPEEVAARPVAVKVPAHSPALAPAAADLVEELAGIVPVATVPGATLISTVTGDVVVGDALGPAYWGENLLRRVAYRAAVARALRSGCDHVVEIGPHPTLRTATLRTAADADRQVTYGVALHRGCDAEASVAAVLADAYLVGAPVSPPVHPVARPARLPVAEWDGARLGPGPTGPAEPAEADEVDRPDWPWEPTDHLVFGEPWTPGAGVVAAVLGRMPSRTLEDVRFVEPGFDRPGATHGIRCTVGADGLAVSYRVGGAVVLTARSVRDGGPVAAPPAPPDASARTVVGADLYAHVEGRGLVLGPPFRTVVAARTTGETAEVELRPGPAEGWAAVALAIDAGFQALGAATVAAGPDAAPEVHVPRGVGRVVVHEAGPAVRARCRVTRAADGAVAGDVVLLGAAGERLVTLEGIDLAAVAAVPDDDADEVVTGPFAAAWVPDEGAAAAVEPRPAIGVVGPAALRTRVEDAVGGTAPAGAVPALVVQVVGPDDEVGPAVAGAAAALRALGPTGRWGAVVVGEGPAAAAVAAVSRSLALEDPPRCAGVVAVEPRADAADLRRAVAALAAPAVADARIRDHGLERAVLDVVAGDGPAGGAPRVDPGATYLVVGAFGPVGRAAARALVDLGAGGLVLLARHAATGDRAAHVAALRERGVEVECLAVDVGDAAAVRAALDHRRSASARRIDGVVHAVGVRLDRLAAELTHEDVAAGVDAKLASLDHVGAAVAPEGPAWLVQMLSIAGVTGAPGQAAYAAANAAAAAHAARAFAGVADRRALFLGPWASSGMGADAAERLTARGLVAWDDTSGRRALGAALATGRDAVVVAAFHRERLADSLQLAPSPMLAALAGAGAGAEDVVAAYRDAPAGERVALVEEALLAALARVLGTDADRLDPTLRAQELGLDSLGALEVCRRVGARIGWTPQPGDLFADVPLEEVARAVEVASRPVAAGDEPPPAPPGRAALSDGQRAVLTSSLLDPTGSRYTIGLTVPVTGRQEAERTAAAVAAVLGGHEVLASRIVLDAGVPWFDTGSAAVVGCAVADEVTPDVGAACEAVLGARFDVFTGPLARASVVRRSADEFVLCVALHHVCVDQWSVQTILQDVQAVLAGGSPSRSSVADWHRVVTRIEAHATDDRVAAATAWWDDRFAAAPLPAPAPGTAAPSAPASQVAVVLAGEVADGIRQRSRAIGASTQASILSTVAAHLPALLGVDRAVVGVTLTLRGLARAWAEIGYCATVVPWVLDRAAAPTPIEVRDLLGGAGETAFLGTAAIVARGGAVGAERVTRPFDALVSYQMVPSELRGTGRARLLAGAGDEGTTGDAPAGSRVNGSPAPVTIVVVDDGHEIVLNVEVQPGHLDPAHVHAFGHRLDAAFDERSVDAHA